MHMTRLHRAVMCTIVHCLNACAGVGRVIAESKRSEERRGGKACSSRGSADH